MKNRLKELRIEKGLTQDELASYLKVARSNISKYEQGTVDLSNEFLIQLSNFFNVTTDYLLGLSDIRDPYEVETIAAHKDGEEWTEEEMAAIEQFKEFVRSQKKKNQEE